MMKILPNSGIRVSRPTWFYRLATLSNSTAVVCHCNKRMYGTVFCGTPVTHVAFHNGFMSSIVKSWLKSWCYYLKNNDLIRSQFFTCHDSSAFVTRASLWTDWVDRMIITKRQKNGNFSQELNYKLINALWNVFLEPACCNWERAIMG